MREQVFTQTRTLRNCLGFLRMQIASRDYTLKEATEFYLWIQKEYSDLLGKEPYIFFTLRAAIEYGMSELS